MTNILLLPMFASSTAFAVATNSDWIDQIGFVTEVGGSTPLDLTGISFEAEMRDRVGGMAVLLALSTDDGTLLNSGATGVLAFSVPESIMQYVPPDSYVMDIVAKADGHIVNLFPDGPASVVVVQGVTTP